MKETYINALKALSHPNRLQLFWVVLNAGRKISITEATDRMNAPQEEVTNDLETLHKAGLVILEKEMNCLYYRAKEQVEYQYQALENSIRFLPDSFFNPDKEQTSLPSDTLDNNENGIKWQYHY